MGSSGISVDDIHRFSPAAPGEKHVYGACSPYWHSACENDVAVEQWLSFVQSEDIERVCCLLAGREKEMRETSLQKYQEVFGDANVCHAPTRDKHLIEHDTLAETILPFLAESVRKETAVVVHCLSGIGRTGQVLAAWLVAARGYEPGDAIETVKRTGRDPTVALEREDTTEEDLYELLDAMPAIPIERS